MRFGIVILPDQPWFVARERWTAAEELGFDYAWTYDHLGWRDLVNGPWFDAVPTLTAAALVTSRIRLGTLVASPNFRHPVHFAREVIALDDVSNGRITLGVGAGGLSFDALVLGVPELTPRARVDRFAEFIELLDLMLRTDHVNYRGDYYTALDARSLPGCIQRPRCPFVLAANGPRSIGIAARHGQGWVTAGAKTDDQEEWWRSVADASRRFDEQVSAAGRDPATVDKHLSLDSGPTFSLSSASFFEDAVARAEKIGFSDVVTHWPRESGWYAGSEAVLSEVASSLPRRPVSP